MSGTVPLKHEQLPTESKGKQFIIAQGYRNSCCSFAWSGSRMGYTPEVVQRMSQDERFTALDQLLQTDEDCMTCVWRSQLPDRHWHQEVHRNLHPKAFTDDT
eukprot:5870700-Amphidinium_carterae.1